MVQDGWLIILHSALTVTHLAKKLISYEWRIFVAVHFATLIREASHLLKFTQFEKINLCISQALLFSQKCGKYLPKCFCRDFVGLVVSRVLSRWATADNLSGVR